MNTEGTGFYNCKECHTTESLSKHATIIHKEREQPGDRRNVGESSCNSGDGTGQMAQPLMIYWLIYWFYTHTHTLSHSLTHSLKGLHTTKANICLCLINPRHRNVRGSRVPRILNPRVYKPRPSGRPEALCPWHLITLLLSRLPYTTQSHSYTQVICKVSAHQALSSISYCTHHHDKRQHTSSYGF